MSESKSEESLKPDPNPVMSGSDGSAAKRRDRSPAGAGKKYDILRTELIGLYGGVGMLVANFNQADGMIIVESAEPIADAWVSLARTNERVYRVLKSLCGASAIGAVIALHASMLMAIAKNHGISPLGKPKTNELNGHADNELSAIPH